jgi:hypothetical protein
MPYKLRKAPKRDLYWVIAEDGRHKSNEPMPLERAKAQMRALYANMKDGKGLSGGGRYEDIEEELDRIEAQTDAIADEISRAYARIRDVEQEMGDNIERIQSERREDNKENYHEGVVEHSSIEAEIQRMMEHFTGIIGRVERHIEGLVKRSDELIAKMEKLEAEQSSLEGRGKGRLTGGITQSKFDEEAQVFSNLLEEIPEVEEDSPTSPKSPKSPISQVKKVKTAWVEFRQKIMSSLDSEQSKNRNKIDNLLRGVIDYIETEEGHQIRTDDWNELHYLLGFLERPTGGRRHLKGGVIGTETYMRMDNIIELVKQLHDDMSNGNLKDALETIQHISHLFNRISDINKDNAEEKDTIRGLKYYIVELQKLYEDWRNRKTIASKNQFVRDNFIVQHFITALRSAIPKAPAGLLVSEDVPGKFPTMATAPRAKPVEAISRERSNAHDYDIEIDDDFVGLGSLHGKGFFSIYDKAMDLYNRVFTKPEEPIPVHHNAPEPTPNTPTTLPDKNTLHQMAEASYSASPPRVLNGYDLVESTPTLKFYRKNGGVVIVVAIRGTKPTDAEDVKADGLIALNRLGDSHRFQKDLRTMGEFMNKYPPSRGYMYYGVGHSLGGAILDMFLKNGMIKQGISYNPAVQPMDIRASLPNLRIYEEGDPLYALMGRFTTAPEVRKTKRKKSFVESAISHIPYIGTIAKANDYLQSHNLSNFQGGAESPTPGNPKFMSQLSRLNISPSSYLEEAKKRAKANHYPYKLLGFSNDGVHKLQIPNKHGKIIRFGRVGYGDYIIWTHQEKAQKVEKGYADDKRDTFHKSHSKIRGEWKTNLFSPNNLALKILW